MDEIYTKNKRNIGRKINYKYWVANAVSVGREEIGAIIHEIYAKNKPLI